MEFSSTSIGCWQFLDSNLVPATKEEQQSLEALYYRQKGKPLINQSKWLDCEGWGFQPPRAFISWANYEEGEVRQSSTTLEDSKMALSRSSQESPELLGNSTATFNYLKFCSFRVRNIPGGLRANTSDHEQSPAFPITRVRIWSLSWILWWTRVQNFHAWALHKLTSLLG